MRRGFGVLVCCVIGCSGATGSGGSPGAADAVSRPGADAQAVGQDTFVPPEACLVNPSLCDDKNPCTTDQCDPASGCMNLVLSGPCDDGDPCTSNDWCSAGQCKGAAVACDDGEACTQDSCDAAGACVHALQDVPGCGLEIVIDMPDRGTTVCGLTSVTASGHVTAPGAQVVSLTLNGQPLAAGSGGGFSSSVQAEHGTNVIVIEASDSLGRTDRAVRAFLYGEEFHPPPEQDEEAAFVKDGVLLFLDKEVIDDDYLADVDDFATVAFLMLEGLDVESLLAGTKQAEGEGPSFLWCTWDVTVTNVDYAVTQVDFYPVPDGLHLTAEISGLSADVSAIASMCPDAVGTVFVEKIVLDAVLTAALGPLKTIELQTESVDVEITGVNVNMTGGAASLFDWLVNLFSESLADELEQTLEEKISSTLVPALETALASVADFEKTFETLPTIWGDDDTVWMTVRVRPSSLKLDWDGAWIGVEGSVGTSWGGLHASPGSLARAGCLDGFEQPFSLPSSSPMEAAVHDDVLNEILFAMWYGGLLKTEIGPGFLDQYVSGYGLKDAHASADALLPPVVTDCNGALEVQIGDAFVSASFSVGESEGSFEAYGSSSIELTLWASDGELGLTVGGVKTMAFEVVSVGGIFEGNDAVMESVLNGVLIDSLLQALSTSALASIPIPEIDLGGLVPGIPAGTTIALYPTSAVHADGHTVLTGKVER
jgi:hypothetical protein